MAELGAYDGYTQINFSAGSWTIAGTPVPAMSTVDDATFATPGEVAFGEMGWSEDAMATYTGGTIDTYPIYEGSVSGLGTGLFFVVHTTGYTVPMTGSAAMDNPSMLCFLKGTLISTSEGDVAIETLSAGDTVITATGETATVKFVFTQQAEALSPFRPKKSIAPIFIMAGALSENVPSADMQVSPDHALLIDGCMVEARTLVNGVSIYQQLDFSGAIEYYHVEMDQHEVIMANGTAAESFIDNVSRQTFDNYADYKALYPADEVEMEELSYPRVKSARQLPKALHDSLAARAKVLGARETA